MPINLPTYEQQQQALTLLQELGVDIDTLLAGRVVKSVQRGYQELTQSYSGNITIATVNPEKCICEIKTSATGTPGQALVKSMSATNIEYVFQASNTTENKLSWYVVEFY